MNSCCRHLLWFRCAKSLLLGLFVVPSWGTRGGDFGLEAAGARFGFAPFGLGHTLHQAEGFANWNLPWSWDLGSSWRLGSRLDLSAGWLGDPDNAAAVVTIGPSLVLRPGAFPVSLEAGVSPTVLTHYIFESKDLGMPFQFTSHVGLNLDVTTRVRVGYRFQHMSNAGLSSHNPGLNLHMVGVSYLF